MTRSAAALICLLFSISQLQAQVSQANDSIEQSRDSILFANALQGIVPASIFGDLNTVRTIKKPFPRHPKLSYWTKINRFGLDLSEVAFVNWNSGGSNSISGLFNLDIKRIYELNNLRWYSEFIGQYGINSQENQRIRKTEDNLEINSTLGYRSDTLSNWFYSAKFNFNTQFSNGYNYPNTSKKISTLMAPGYLLLGGGVEYGEQMQALNAYASPLTLKSTFVLNQRLANEGSFGVKEAVKNDEGEIIEKGEQIRNEFGILITGELNTRIFNNIVVENKVRLYTDYINHFGNIDVDWQLQINFQVNDFVRAKISSHLKYDDDIKIQRTDNDGNLISSGPKVQWKQQLGIGIIIQI
jgi:hypothetical protein